MSAVSEIVRCPWVASGDERLVRYHDEEWGVPVHDDTRLFELLVLEGAQAGLSWSTVLKKREGYRGAFAGFDPVKVAAFGERERAALLADAGIVRHRGKIDSAVENARALLAVARERGSFAKYLWGFVDGRPVHGGYRGMSEVPAKTPLSEQISKDLLRRGFRFVGPTIVQAYLQATGVVNDHLVTCFRQAVLARDARPR